MTASYRHEPHRRVPLARRRHRSRGLPVPPGAVLARGRRPVRRGLGQGSAKWDYLPNAHNDFIFAIIGEELGFVGAFAVLGLFGTLAYAGLRIATRISDPWLKLVVATSTTWLVGQAAINIAYVVGLLPVTGLSCR